MTRTDSAIPGKVGPAVVAVAIFCIYVATLAPTVTYWDAGEFLSAIHSLGIPHPPGTPVFVFVANVWAKVLSPFAGFAYSINLFSAASTAVGCGIAALLMQRWTGDGWAAVEQQCAVGANVALNGRCSAVDRAVRCAKQRVVC